VPAPLRFLPDFDNLVLAHDDRTRVIPEEYRGRITTKNLRVRATFLVDGFVAGTWKAERKGKAATLTIEPFKKLPRGVTGPLKDEAAALLAFMEPEATKANVKVV
jgi:hypothetical protein